MPHSINLQKKRPLMDAFCMKTTIGLCTLFKDRKISNTDQAGSILTGNLKVVAIFSSDNHGFGISF